jgi:hypothetical protein
MVRLDDAFVVQVIDGTGTRSTLLDLVLHTRPETKALHELVEAIAKLNTIEDAVAWASALAPPSAVIDLAVHDAVTHDVIMKWQDSMHVAFTATCKGAIEEVSVWDHQPSAAELRSSHISSGWRSKGRGEHRGCRVIGIRPN